MDAGLLRLAIAVVCLLFGLSSPPARADSAPASCEDPFFSRLSGAYKSDADGNGPAASNLVPTQGRRGLPAPFDSPPLPSAEWQLGGVDYPIGVPDEDSRGPLQQALGCDAFGRWMDEHRIEMLGWINPSANLSTSNKTNYPVSYISHPDALVLDQVIFRVARMPDTVQTDHVDWGFHFDFLYGYDYRYTAAQGVVSWQLEENKYYGYDPMIWYGDIYVPNIAQGMQITVGRFLSLPDIEAQFAPQNYLMTHSILYTVDPYTQMGVITTTQLNKNWILQAGINCSPDTACWESDRSLTGSVCVRWVSDDNDDMLYPCANSFNKGDANYNNLQAYVLTWGHRFSQNVSTLTEAYRMWERNVPGFLPGNTPEYGAVNYLNIKLSDKTFMSIRNEYYNDAVGQRTGFATHYSSHTLGFTHWLTPDFQVRPEFRFDHSYDLAAYDGGRKNNQLLAAVDVILHY
ncbi:MAG TPA: outer membrane beta-barrel protein [Gammaproteobacteria bacterium]|nr:outer membrane beta-barrel protein [Gammaproteobacteria bacterium]